MNYPYFYGCRGIACALMCLMICCWISESAAQTETVNLQLSFHKACRRAFVSADDPSQGYDYNQSRIITRGRCRISVTATDSSTGAPVGGRVLQLLSAYASALPGDPGCYIPIGYPVVTDRRGRAEFTSEVLTGCLSAIQDITECAHGTPVTIEQRGNFTLSQTLWCATARANPRSVQNRCE